MKCLLVTGLYFRDSDSHFLDGTLQNLKKSTLARQDSQRNVRLQARPYSAGYTEVAKVLGGLEVVTPSCHALRHLLLGQIYLVF